MAILWTIAAPVALYLIFRSLAGEVYPQLAPNLPPANNAALIKDVAPLAFQKDALANPAWLEIARLSAASDPMAAMPLVVAGRAAEYNGDLSRAVALLEEARRRRPRSMPTRLYLLSLYGRTGRVPEFLGEMSYVLSINEQTRFLLLPELVKRLSSADVRRDLAGLLATNPAWRTDFYNVARGDPPVPEHALDLLRRVAAQGGDVAEEERLYIVSLLKAGRADLARQRRLALLPEPQRARNRFLFNGDFSSDSIAAGEFGWTFSPGANGRADIAEAGGGKSQLNVQYHGGATAVLAQQLLALAPGAYQITIVGRGRGDAVPGGRFVWDIKCEDGPELLRVTPELTSAQDKSVTRRFIVPAGCARGQSLRLVGEPGEASVLTEAQFTLVAIADAR